MNRAQMFRLAALTVAGCVVAFPGCSKKPSENANKDMQKQQTNLMNAMDKIAAEEEKKRTSGGDPQDQPAAPLPAPAPPAPASDANNPASPPTK